MPTIKPVSDLRNYNTVLNEVSEGNPVYLTKNGYGKYAVVDLAEYEKIQSSMKLLAELAEAEQEISDGVDLISQADIDKEFGLV